MGKGDACERHIARFVLAAAILLVLGCTAAAREPGTATIETSEYLFEEMFVGVLLNLLENYSLENGDWTHSEMRDIIGFSPRMLFDLYRETGNTHYLTKATATVNFELSQLGTALLDPNAFKDAAAGALALVDGYRYLGQNLYRIGVGPLSMIFNGMIIRNPALLEDPLFSFYDPMYMAGAVIGISREFYDAVRSVKGDPDISAIVHLCQAQQIHGIVDEKYWDPTYGCYRWHRGDPVLYFGHQPNMLLARALEYQLTGKESARTLCDTFLCKMKGLWWDEAEGGYFSETNPGSYWYNYKGLAEHMVVLMALTLLYEATLDSTYLEQSTGLLEFIETHLYGKDESGRPIILHDTYGGIAWCSGCNMFTTYAIYRLNRKLGNPLPPIF